METNNYVVSLIFSNWTLTEIFNFFEDYLETTKEHVGAVKIERYKNKQGVLRESNRTVMLITRELFSKATNKGLNNKQPSLDFQIDEYKLSDKHFPRNNQIANIFLSFPKDIPYNDIDIQIRDKLKIFKKFGLLKHNYKLVIPLESRETEEHRGFGYLNFTQDNLTERALIRLLLHDSKLFTDNNKKEYLQAYWVKNKKPKEDKL